MVKKLIIPAFVKKPMNIAGIHNLTIMIAEHDRLNLIDSWVTVSPTCNGICDCD